MLFKKYSDNNNLQKGGNDLLYRIKLNSIQTMATQAENLLNPSRYYLSAEAKKRLRWLYILYYECNDNITKSANKIGVSREWLSKIKSIFEKNKKDPRSLEPKSRAPNDTSDRNRISQEKENKILEIRDEYPWGEEKISTILLRDYHLKVSKNTVNRYLHRHKRINPKISAKNKNAWKNKKQREKQKQINLKIKYRPPTKIKDYLPGALVEKDMKLVPKGRFTKPKDSHYHLKDYFYYQHTFIDSFTRIRGIELTKKSSSRQAETSYQKVKKRMPFNFAAMNTDNGGENEKDFSKRIQKDDIIHFYSREGTPTDNPRVERSHLTDEIEFYQQGNICQTFEKQKQENRKWEHIYNWIRPHQALGYLTPMEFYQLWKEKPDKAYQIVEKYQNYLKRQRKRLAKARRMKKKEQIEKLMKFIDAKLKDDQDNKNNQKNKQKVDLNPYKLELINCELCSWG